MKESEIIFMDQLLHHRSVASQILQTRLTWQRRSSWFPQAQFDQYSQVNKVYADCLDKYGKKNFEYYAKRNRLHKEYTASNSSSLEAIEVEERDISMDHLAGYKVPLTTNGEYGSIRPSQLHFC